MHMVYKIYDIRGDTVEYKEFLEYVKGHPGCFETHEQKSKEFEYKVKTYLEQDKSDQDEDEDD